MLLPSNPQQPEQAPTPPAIVKPKRIPERILQAIDLLESGKCATQAATAERVGIRPEHLCRYLKKDHVRAFLTQRRRDNVAIGSLRASQRIVELVDAESEHVSANVSMHLLAIEGIKPVEKGTNVNITNNIAGYVINLGPRDATQPGDSAVIIEGKNTGNTDASD